MLLAVLVQASDAATIDQLVRALDSVSADQRTAASKELLERGEAAIPALKAAARGSDANLRLLTRDLLSQIAAQVRAQAYQPKCIRASFEITDKPFSEALDELSKRYGMQSPRFDLARIGRRISVHVQEATLWEALSIFCKAARCQQSCTDFSLRPEPEWRSPYEQCQDRGDVRIYLDSGTYSNAHDRTELRMTVALPPGSWIEKIDVSELSIRDEGGKIQKAERAEPGVTCECERAKGVPSWARVPTYWIDPSPLKPGSKLTVEGKLEIHLPKRIETLASWAPEQGPAFEFPGVKVAVGWRADTKSLYCTVRGDPERNPPRFQIGAWGTDGTCLFDLGPYRIEAAEILSCRDVGVCPSKLEAWTVTTTYVRTVPFTFASVPFYNGH